MEQQIARQKIKDIIAIWATKDYELNEYEYSKQVRKMENMMLELVSDKSYKDDWNPIIEASAGDTIEEEFIRIEIKITKDNRKRIKY